MNDELQNLLQSDWNSLYQLKQVAENVILYWDAPASEAENAGWLHSMQNTIKEVFYDAATVNRSSQFMEEQLLADARNDCMTLVYILHRNAGMSRNAYGGDVPHSVSSLRTFVGIVSRMLRHVTADERDEKAIAKPIKPYPQPTLLARDQFIWENILTMSMKELKQALENKKNFGLPDKVTSAPGLRDAAWRYSDHYHLPTRNFRKETPYVATETD